MKIGRTDLFYICLIVSLFLSVRGHSLLALFLLTDIETAFSNQVSTRRNCCFGLLIRYDSNQDLLLGKDR